MMTVFNQTATTAMDRTPVKVRTALETFADTIYEASLRRVLKDICRQPQPCA